MLLINPSEKNIHNFFQLEYNSFEELQKDLILAVSIFKIKRRDIRLLKFFNTKQKGIEKEFEKIFFHHLLSFKQIDKISIENKKFIESFYLKYFSYNNFRKIIHKDFRIIPLAIFLSILIDSEIIFYDFLNFIDFKKRETLHFMIIQIIDYSLEKYNFYDKKLIVDFLDLLKLNLDPKVFNDFINKQIIVNTFLLPYNAYLLKNELINF